jgi:hypothetical protein
VAPVFYERFYLWLNGGNMKVSSVPNEKKEYERPALTKHGALRDLTKKKAS